MNTISVPGRTGAWGVMLGVVLAGIPLTALAAGLDAGELVATCQTIMHQFAGSMACGG